MISIWGTLQYKEPLSLSDTGAQQPGVLFKLLDMTLRILGNIWKDTVEKSQINAPNVTMHPLMHMIWGDIWKHTVEKNQINAMNVSIHPLGYLIWEDISKRTVEKSQISVTNVTMHLFMQAI